jgi:hypothetical protein
MPARYCGLSRAHAALALLTGDGAKPGSGLLALFTHIHLFWIAALLLALVDLPDFGTPLRSIAGSVEKIAESAVAEASDEEDAATEPTVRKEAGIPKKEVHGHA